MLLIGVAELYLVKLNVQDAFDRSIKIASDDTIFLETVDLPINNPTVIETFEHFLANNLNLNESSLTMNQSQKVRNVVIDEFQVINVYEPTSIEIVNPLTGEVLRGTVTRPSIAVLAHVEVKIGMWPVPINIPMFALSSDLLPV